MQARVSEDTLDKLHEIAASMGYIYGSGASIGSFLDAIAQRELVVIPENVWKKLVTKSPKTD